jgi:site-specific DNA-methyltransferase (adenine-specific)
MNRLRRDGLRHSSDINWKVPGTTYHIARVADAAELLRELPDGSVQLAVIDPPYNLEMGDWDRYDDYMGWAKGWLEQLPRVLKDSGNAVIFGGFQFQTEKGGDLLEVMHYLRHRSGLRLVNLIIWNYSTGMGAHRFFANRHEEIAWYAKTDKYYFDLDAVREKFDPRTLIQYLKDKRLNPENVRKGKNPGNVWRFERLSANSLERVGHPTQKPAEVIRRIVKALSYPGSVVIDPFAGSAVTFRVCAGEKRHSILGDNDAEFLSYIEAQMRLMGDDRSGFCLLGEDAMDEFFERTSGP